MTQYWTYVNKPHQHSIVHIAECGSCNFGKGIHGGGTTKSGSWFGPFDSRMAAIAKGLEFWPDETLDCRHCAGR